MKMSAAVSSAPQRYLPSPGDVASCCSRKSKCVFKVFVKKMEYTLDEIARVIGRMKNGVAGLSPMSTGELANTDELQRNPERGSHCQ